MLQRTKSPSETRILADQVRGFSRNNPRHGQAALDYAVFIAVVAAGLIGMQVYIRRSIQANLKTLEDQINAEAISTVPSVITPPPPSNPLPPPPPPPSPPPGLGRGVALNPDGTCCSAADSAVDSTGVAATAAAAAAAADAAAGAVGSAVSGGISAPGTE